MLGEPGPVCTGCTPKEPAAGTRVSQWAMEIRLVPRAKAILLWASVALGLVLLLRAPHILSPFVWAFVTAYVLQPAVSAANDAGRPLSTSAPESAAGQVFASIAERISTELLPPLEMAGCTARILADVEEKLGATP